MTKKLEDILNLPHVKEQFKEVDKKEKDRKIKESNGNPSTKNLDPQTQKNLQKSYAEFDKVAAALPQVKGLGELSALELDKLAVLEQQVLDIEKRNNQTYLQNQQLLKEQKRQRQAQALMNLGSAISGAGTSGAIAPPISNPSYSDSYSSTLTVNQGDMCPRLNSPLVKQEVRGVNRICYYQ